MSRVASPSVVSCGGLSSALAVFLAVLQACFGEVAWFLYLALIRSAMEDAPEYLDRGTFVNYEGWSFWAFFSAVHWTLLITSMYLFVEVAACCAEDRRRRFASTASFFSSSKKGGGGTSSASRAGGGGGGGGSYSPLLSPVKPGGTVTVGGRAAGESSTERDDDATKTKLQTVFEIRGASSSSGDGA